VEEQPNDENLNSSLEDDIETNIGDVAPGSETSQIIGNKSIKQSLVVRLRSLASRVNVYLVLFGLTLLLGIGVIIVSNQKSKQEVIKSGLTLTSEDIDKIKNSDAKVGDPKQILTIESNAIFSGKVLVRDSLDVAGTIKVGGSMSLPGITVSGASSFDQITANSLSISGNTTLQGAVNIQKSLSVSGNATFGGNISAPQLTVDSIKITKDLTLSRHIDAGGSTPSKSDGNALGSGGTSSVSGTDTAGTLKINTGGSPGAGCFATIHFVIAFNETPHVVVTPVGSSAGNLAFYINRSTTNFSICSVSTPPSNTSFSFDWVAID